MYPSGPPYEPVIPLHNASRSRDDIHNDIHNAKVTGAIYPHVAKIGEAA